MPRKPKPKARRTLIYGADRIGKSAWAAKWPKPLFLDIGKRLTRVYETDSPNWTPTFPELDFLGIDGGKPYFESLAFEGDDALPKAAQIIARLGSIEPQANRFRTLVIDSAESLSHLIFKKAEGERLAELRTAEPMAAGSHKGSENHFIANRQGLRERTDGFKEFLSQNIENVIQKGIHVLFIAGSETDKKTGKHWPRLWTTSKGFGVRSALIDYCDEVLFCQRRFPDGERFQVQQELSGNKEWEFAKGKSETVIHTADSSKHFAKKGIELPAEIPMTKTGFEFGEFLPIAK